MKRIKLLNFFIDVKDNINDEFNESCRRFVIENSCN